MMRRLDLDFQQQRNQASGTGILLLVIALLLGGKLFSDYRDTAVELEAGAAKIQRLERLAGRKPVRVGKGDERSGEEIKRANEVIAQLALPWDQLFAAVESAMGKDIALLSIQPDRRKGMVAIGGEAKDVAAMLDYMRRLNEKKPLKQVVLLSHQIQQQDPQKPVRFNLSAQWVME